jgi:small-conductance mechanosensitive channel
MAEEAATGYLVERVDALREHLSSLAAALPLLPGELARVGEQVGAEMAARGHGTVLLLFLGFVGLGFLVEGIYRYALAQRLPAVSHRAAAIGLRFVRDGGALAAFTIGSVAAFLAFDWPGRTRGAVIALLAVFICVRAALVASRTLLSPSDARLRIVPADDAAAAFWQRRIVLFSGWLAFGWMLAERLGAVGMSPPARALVVYILGLGLLAVAFEALWRRSRAAALATVVLWALWVVKAMGLFWLALVALALPFVLKLIQASVDHVLRPADAVAAGTRGVLAAALGRALRALAIIGAAILLVHAFNLDVDALAAAESFWPRLLRGAVQALAIVLLADLAWLVAASLIDQKLAQDSANARLQTLLPIVRGTLAVVLLVMTVLMGLSALGVQVGPLIAGAGVVGVAVGFGSQTLVRDLFAKFTYLMDDAFRVGEYIESGSFKGTVERLGGRSVRLRHHRGPIFTIPYGQLGAVKNSSRDWVIDKMTLGVTYDTDLDKAKKLIKKIGQKLAEDPEFAPKILEPLKMQGVEQFGDFAIQIRIKMKTVPNEQFAIRRRAYAMIKQAFAENGIHFAFPTVQVAGGGDAAAAVASAEVRALKAAQSQE